MALPLLNYDDFQRWFQIKELANKAVDTLQLQKLGTHFVKRGTKKNLFENMSINVFSSLLHLSCFKYS